MTIEELQAQLAAVQAQIAATNETLIGLLLAERNEPITQARGNNITSVTPRRVGADNADVLVPGSGSAPHVLFRGMPNNDQLMDVAPVQGARADQGATVYPMGTAPPPRPTVYNDHPRAEQYEALLAKQFSYAAPENRGNGRPGRGWQFGYGS
jgi:hypothetical protein